MAVHKIETMTATITTASSSKNYHVLAVDDNPIMLMYFKRILESFNTFTISTVNNGKEAIEWLENTDREDVHLIITDIYMPYVNGFELLKHVKGNSKLRLTPVVVTSSSEEETDKVKSLNMGAAQFVCKPCKANEFKQYITQIFSNH